MKFDVSLDINIGYVVVETYFEFVAYFRMPYIFIVFPALTAILFTHIRCKYSSVRYWSFGLIYLVLTMLIGLYRISIFLSSHTGIIGLFLPVISAIVLFVVYVSTDSKKSLMLYVSNIVLSVILVWFIRWFLSPRIF